MQKNGSSQEILDSLSDKSTEHEFYSPIPENYKVGKTKNVIITGSGMSGVG